MTGKDIYNNTNNYYTNISNFKCKYQMMMQTNKRDFEGQQFHGIQWRPWISTKQQNSSYMGSGMGSGYGQGNLSAYHQGSYTSRQMNGSGMSMPMQRGRTKAMVMLWIMLNPWGQNQCHDQYMVSPSYGSVPYRDIIKSPTHKMLWLYTWTLSIRLKGCLKTQYHRHCHHHNAPNPENSFCCLAS